MAENRCFNNFPESVTAKGFIRFAAQESGEAETADAANVMKPLSELNGESSLTL